MSNEKVEKERPNGIVKQVACVICLLLVILAIVLGLLLSGSNNNHNGGSNTPTDNNRDIGSTTNSTLISNLQCNDAVEAVPDGSSDVGVISSSDENWFSNTEGTCGSAAYGASPGKWYYFVGTGERIDISVCTSGCSVPLNSVVVAEVTVFEGSCDDLICLNGIGDLGQGGPLEIATTEGKTYFLYIQGEEGSTGLYELSFDER
eukprot:Nitzschia sp. Nitz4//scaffold154_size52827//46974//47585//NITZ4_006786-RA/size52827-exonerate_est2genome-gene-0.33-mRNA-1//1//CDS//3329537338//2081//frame0